MLFATACGRIGFDAQSREGADDAVVAGDVPLATCTPGMRATGTRVLNASLSPLGDACNLDNALAADGAGAGLDRTVGSQCSSQWDNSGSCGCLAVDLGTVRPLASIEIVARPVSLACTAACQTATCGTGRTLAVLTGLDEGQYSLPIDIMLTSAAFTTYTRPAMRDARYIVVCRQAYGEERDDFEIDFVSAICR